MKSQYIRYIPNEFSTVNTPNSNTYIYIPRGDSVNSSLNSFLGWNFDVLHAANPDNRYTDDDGIRLVNLGPFALFSNYEPTSSNGKHFEEISHPHNACLLYKLLTSSKDSDELSIGFDRDRDRRRRELTNNKNIKGKYHVKIMLRDIFGFAEQQEKATYGLGYKLTLTRNNGSAVLNKDNAVNDAKVKINSIGWVIPQNTPSVKQQTILMNQIVNKVPTDLHYIERSGYMQEVKNQNVWQFHVRTEEGINLPIFIIICFQQQVRGKSQNHNDDTFCRLHVTSAQCIVGTEKHLD